MNSILFNVDDGIATITLNRPERLNSFDASMAEAWARITTDAVSNDEVGAIVVLGSGRAFCAGGDIRAMAETDNLSSSITELANRINVGIRALVESAKPVVAGAHGTTAGGGLGILLSTDYAIVGNNSKLGSLYANVGLTPDLSVSALLARAIGERRALALTLQDRLLSAEEALEWGLVAEVVSDDAVATRAYEIAHHWRQTPYAYGHAKRLIRSQPDQTFVEQLAEEARSIGAASQTPQATKRIRAFSSR